MLEQYQALQRFRKADQKTGRVVQLPGDAVALHAVRGIHADRAVPLGQTHGAMRRRPPGTCACRH